MPGFVIHLAVGKRYIEKHEKQIKNMEDFLKGLIEPDLYKKQNERKEYKVKTHYSKSENNHTIIDINRFLKDKKVDIKKDYWKGYFIHLITDYYFYNIEFIEECKKAKENNDKFYYDYDCLNKDLISKYNINKYKLAPKIKESISVIDGKPKYLTYNKLVDFIEKISNLDINKQIKIIKENGMEGLK